MLQYFWNRPYAAFERVLDEAHEREPLRTLAFCVLPNHWHMVVWPKQGADQQVSEFFRWLTVTHTQRWHAHYHTAGSGHLYQGRFRSFPVETDEHLYTVLRYVRDRKGDSLAFRLNSRSLSISETVPLSLTQKRNTQARKSHTKTTRRKLRQLGTKLTDIKRVPWNTT